MKLIDQIFSDRNLTEACGEVVRNKGASGVDGMNVAELKQHLDTHREGLKAKARQCNYTPQPIRGKEIPKGSGKMRLLGIPTVIDRMLQQAVSRVIMPRYEYMFSDYSYGFRPQRNTHQAVQLSLGYIHAGYQDIVEIDLEGFFDNVDHVLLLQLLYRKVKCRATLCLIKRWLRVPLWRNGRLEKRRRGVPQGSPISPLLSNIMLHELDMEMHRLGLRFVRYADDFSIYCSSKDEARQAKRVVESFLHDKLKLPINHGKSGIRRPSTYQILGYGFVPTYRRGEKGRYQLTVTEKRWASLKEKLREITRKTSPMSFTERIQRILWVQRGWVNYFRHASMQQKLKRVDSWLRKRLRYCIWHDWKKPERKRKNLIRLGVEAGQAYAWSRTRMGGWAVACSPILRTTVTLARLRQRGYKSMLDIYYQVSPLFEENPTLPM